MRRRKIHGTIFFTVAFLTFNLKLIRFREPLEFINCLLHKYKCGSLEFRFLAPMFKKKKKHRKAKFSSKPSSEGKSLWR